MLDLIGWTTTTGGDFTVSAYVTRVAGQYTVVAGDVWQPAPGDVVVDPNGLVETVVSVDDATPTEFGGLFEFAGWANGFATITRKVSAPAKTAEVLGGMNAVDNPVTRETDLTLRYGLTIADTLSANAALYSPAGWAHADTVEIDPQSDMLEIQNAMWHTPQGVKMLLNVSETNSFVIKTGMLLTIVAARITTASGSDLVVGPGQSAALVVIDQEVGGREWFAALNSAPLELLSWAQGTFANASTRHGWDATGKALYGPFAGGTPAVVLIDGKRRLQLEGARSSYVANLDGWTIQGLVVRTPGQPDPMGGTDAFKIENIEVGGANSTFYVSSGGVNDAVVSPSIFIKRITTTGVDNYQNIKGVALGRWHLDNADLPDFWDRVTDQHDAVTVIAPWVNDGSGGGGPFLKHQSGGSKDYYLYFPSQEEGAFPSSPIVPGSTTRAADAMSFASGSVPSAIRSGKWSTELTTMHASSDLATSEVMYLYWLDASNHLSLTEDGAGNVQAKLATTSGNIVKTVTYSRDQTVTITPDFVGDQLITTGFTTGNGAVAGTLSDWPSSTLHVGSDSTPANHVFGRMSEPTQAQDVDSIFNAAAGTMAWRTDAEHFTPGTPPDVASAPNRESEIGYADIAQAVASARPHSSGSGVDAVWDFDTSAAQQLSVENASPFLASIGDTITLFFVAETDGTAALRYGLESSGSTGSIIRGVMLQIANNNFRGRFSSVSGGAPTLFHLYTDGGGFNLYRASIEADRFVIAVNGAESESVVTTGGVGLNQHAVSVGKAFANATGWDSGVKHSSILVNASLDTINATEAAIQAYYGTPALP